MSHPVRVKTTGGWQDLALVGAQGPQGPPGATATFFTYDFSSALVEPPTSSQVRFNAAYPYTAATKVWIRDVSSAGRDNRTYLLHAVAGQRLYIQDRNDHTLNVDLTISGPPVGKSGYVEIPVVWVANGGALLNNQQTELAFIGGGSGADLVYNGEYPAGGPDYTDGDVVTYQGRTYICVRPTSAAPVPWSLGARSFYGTTPPASPVEGDEWTYPVGNGVLWRFRYNAASASAYKWEFVGGSPQVSVDISSGGVIVASWNAANPTLTLARAGEYLFSFSATFAGTALGQQFMSVFIGATLHDTDIARTTMEIHNGYSATMARSEAGPLSVPAGGTVCSHAYYANAACTVAHRLLAVKPVRVA